MMWRSVRRVDECTGFGVAEPPHDWLV